MQARYRAFITSTPTRALARVRPAWDPCMTTACSEKGTPKRRLHCSIPLWATEDAEFNLRKISKPRSRDGSQPIRRWAFQSCIDGNDPRVAATTGSDWTGPGAGWGAPRPANDAHSGRSRPQSQGGLPALLAAMVRRSAKLATRSPWRGTAAIRRQSRPTRVGTRQSQAVPP